jgi:inhibitor of cysteine peptidase
MTAPGLAPDEISVFMKIIRLGFVPPTALLSALVASVALSGPAQTPPPLVLTEKDNGATAGALLGQAIDIDLPANPSTGFDWYLASTNGTSVVSNGPVVFTPDSPNVGGPGTMRMPFLAVSTGKTTLSFVYYQSWNPQEIQTNYAVTINVTPPSPVLSITRSGDNVLITWPITNSSAFFLEGTSRLDPPQWEALNVAPLPDGSNYLVALGHSGAPLFFRLHEP